MTGLEFRYRESRCFGCRRTVELPFKLTQVPTVVHHLSDPYADIGHTVSRPFVQATTKYDSISSLVSDQFGIEMDLEHGQSVNYQPTGTGEKDEDDFIRAETGYPDFGTWLEDGIKAQALAVVGIFDTLALEALVGGTATNQIYQVLRANGYTLSPSSVEAIRKEYGT